MYYLIAFIIILIVLLYWFSSGREELDGQPRYVFWTGGFDSTFRICQLLCDPHFIQPIVPVYISDPRVDARSGGRRNRHIELDTITKLREMLVKHFPNAKCQLRPTMYVDKVNTTYNKQWIDKQMRVLRAIGCATRLYTQYTSMAIITLERNIVVEAGTEGRDTGAVSKYFLPWLHDGYQIASDAPDHFKLFKNIRWPLALYHKSDMLREAKRDGYQHILASTFSCWYPLGGKPCGECKMCRERLKGI